MKKHFYSALLMLILVLSANAQGNKLVFHAGGTLPIAKFGGNSIDEWVLLNTSSTTEKGCASAGFYGGLQFNIGIFRGLDFTISLDAYYNSLNKKTLDDALITSISKTPKYFNIPLMAGINYELNINRNLAFYIEGAAGGDLRYTTPLELTILGITTKYSYPPTLAFAWRTGLGIVVADFLTFGVDYNSLGAHKAIMKYGEGNDTYISNNKLKVNLLSLKLGIRFGH